MIPWYQFKWVWLEYFRQLDGDVIVILVYYVFSHLGPCILHDLIYESFAN